jgi:glutamyl-tRNA reductase
MTQLRDLLVEAQVVFAASNAPFYVLSQADMIPIMQARGGRELTLVDIAMPRNIDPEVRLLPGIALSDLDDLQKNIEKNKDERQKAAAQAHHILDEELTRFWADYNGRAAAPTIHQLRQQVEQIRQQELTRILNRLPGEQQQELRLLFEEFSHRFMNKVLHEPTRSLKAKAGQGNGALFNAVARDLFGLKDEA